MKLGIMKSINDYIPVLCSTPSVALCRIKQYVYYEEQIIKPSQILSSPLLCYIIICITSINPADQRILKNWRCGFEENLYASGWQSWQLVFCLKTKVAILWLHIAKRECHRLD